MMQRIPQNAVGTRAGESPGEGNVLKSTADHKPQDPAWDHKKRLSRGREKQVDGQEDRRKTNRKKCQPTGPPYGRRRRKREFWEQLTQVAGEKHTSQGDSAKMGKVKKKVSEQGTSRPYNKGEKMW